MNLSRMLTDRTPHNESWHFWEVRLRYRFMSDLTVPVSDGGMIWESAKRQVI